MGIEQDLQVPAESECHIGVAVGRRTTQDEDANGRLVLGRQDARLGALDNSFATKCSQ
jgi:hypothetical protein